ncbi:MAG: UvrB/UvrC motif-containing protein [Phycisphaerales bacterium]
MSDDLTNLLRDWPYQPGQLAVRVIEGDDGRPKIQMRLDLGLLQMEMDGRPDGMQPEGFDSWLERYEAMLDEAESAGEAAGAEVEHSLVLSADDCRCLREEAVQYYQRYVALFVLEDFDGVVRDTSRNLRALDLCCEHAERDEDREALEQFRPYLLMMRARALAGQAVSDGEAKAALLAIDQALDEIRHVFVEAGDAAGFDAATEVQLLRGMREALAPKLPVSPKAELRNRLKQAVEAENYELAAILRDELRNMPD